MPSKATGESRRKLEGQREKEDRESPHLWLPCVRRLVHAEKRDALFLVSKGDDDIRMVYDGTKSGLNVATWVPWFAIPTNATLEQVVVPGTKQADNDLEDMFHNFRLHEAMKELTGVDVSAIFPELLQDGESGVYAAWERCAMGLTGSPYRCYQEAIRAKRVVLGSRKDGANPFH
jgi:hypothetical protein